MIYPVDRTATNELISVWESSVKATHHFLTTEDFEFYKERIPGYFEQVELYCIKNNESRIIGFIGTHGENLEMLFVAADQIGKGIGKALLTYAIGKLGVRKVDVNRDNAKAVAFYQRFGFVEKAVSATDGAGKPYAVLHMELKNKE